MCVVCCVLQGVEVRLHVWSLDRSGTLGIKKGGLGTEMISDDVHSAAADCELHHLVLKPA